MHICFITSEYPKIGFPHGGIGTFIKQISLELARNDYKVSIICINKESLHQEEFFNNISIYRLKPSKIKGLKWFFNSIEIQKQIRLLHKNIPIDILETSELGFAFLSKIKKIKYIIRLHGGHHFLAENGKINWRKAFKEKLSFKKADAFIAVSNHVKIQTELLLGFNNKMVTQIYNPIDLNLFCPIYSSTTNYFNIMFVGTVYKKKGIIQLLDAFNIVKKIIPNANLEIYGPDWFFSDGSSFVESLKKSTIYNLNKESIHFNGMIEHADLPQKYAQASICVFPSLQEAQGLVVVEAMSMEKLVVFTEFGAGKEIIDHGKNGLLCNPNDSSDIAEKIIWVFNNPDKVKPIEKNARQTVLEKFNLKKIVHQNIEFYDVLIHSK